ncbi:MAG TPA: LamG-like jellyroll fold domain-containing protein, partial [Thermoguttaceae bacterium]|nr:LamG-like jellyroll fold domain-containing protein [Thermoguttaceae bacterium]
PLPSFEQGWQFNRIKIPAYAVEPQLKVLLYPYRFGEPLPFTRWSDDRSELLVNFDAQEDTYTFQRGDGGRTVFAMHRSGQPVVTTTSRPAPPQLGNMGGHTPDRNLPESQQQERTLRFADRLDVALAEGAPGCEIRYTLDGSTPNEGSALYTGQIRVTESCELKAVTVHHGWVFDENTSEPLAIDCRRIPASPPIQPDTKQQPGLACEVFSIHHTIFEEDSGFFTGHKNMLPELAETNRLAQVAVDSFTIPPIDPKAPKSEMHKGYYRYRGLLHAPSGGVYRFRVFLCGPVRMTVADQDVIDVTGPYGLSQKYRYGECVLQEGPHTIELTVCDPVFWKGDSFMDLRVDVWQPADTDYRPIPDSWLTRSATQQLEAPVDLTTRATAMPTNVTNLKPGLIEESYDWSGRVTPETAAFVEGSATYTIPNDGLPANFLDDLDESAPYLRQPVWSLSGSNNLNLLTRYVGFFRAVRAGDYAFRTDPGGANRLTIGRHVVACANVQGATSADLLHLEPGLYPLEFVNLFGSGEILVCSPGSEEFRPAVPGELARKAEQDTLPDTRGPVAVIDFESIVDNVVAVKSERSLTARLSGAEPVATPFGQGVAFTGENPYLELIGLQWPARACTVSMWLKRGKTGDSLALRGMPNKFQARLRSKDTVWAGYHRSPDEVHIQAGEKAANKEWFHLAVTFGDWVKVYVDGKLIGRRIVDPSAMYPGSSPYPASMLFMEDETDGQLDEVRIFNRVLSENEIQRLSAP